MRLWTRFYGIRIQDTRHFPTSLHASAFDASQECILLAITVYRLSPPKNYNRTFSINNFRNC